MPTETGIFNEQETNEQYSFSYPLARWIGKYLPKDVPVIDFGCGRASYLAYLQDIGFKSVRGIEGVQQHSDIDSSLISHVDLTIPFNIIGRGNVICLEVGEHIPPEYFLQFIENINGHCQDKLIYSHAIRFQGGLGHVNCLDNIAVIELLKLHKFNLLAEETIKARDVIEQNNCSWFANSLMIFEKVK